jgi:hypothetical protein
LKKNRAFSRKLSAKRTTDSTSKRWQATGSPTAHACCPTRVSPATGSKSTRPSRTLVASWRCGKNTARSKTGWMRTIRAQCVKLFRQNFKFVGGEIVNEFLLSTGYLLGAHEEDCPIFPQVKSQNPPWTIIG